MSLTILPAVVSFCFVLVFSLFAFCALKLLVRRQEEHAACENRVIRCWCAHLSGLRCRLFAYGPADAIASQNTILMGVVVVVVVVVVLSLRWFSLPVTVSQKLLNFFVPI